MPETAQPKLLHDAIVTQQINYGNGYYVLELECPDLAASIDVGQFLNLRIRNELTPLLRRPFSVFDVLSNATGEPRGISILYHIIGVGTAMMADYTKGTKVSLNGPLGKPFSPPPNPKATVIMVGGGIGTAPFLLQARRFMQAEPQRDHVFIAGGRSDRDLKYIKHFAPLVKEGLNMMLCSEDGSIGFKGRVTEPLRSELEAAVKRNEAVHVYCCGPTPMMAAVSELCQELEVACVASLESVMACGYGVCNGCVCAVKDTGSPAGHRYIKTCVEGTSFDASSLIWDELLT